jgi:hypothetical protein
MEMLPLVLALLAVHSVAQTNGELIGTLGRVFTAIAEGSRLSRKGKRRLPK